MADEKKYAAIPYGLSIDITRAIWKEELIWHVDRYLTSPVNWYGMARSPDDIAADRTRYRVERFAKEITEAAFLAVQIMPSLITPMVSEWLIEQAKEWREHECDY